MDHLAVVILLITILTHATSKKLDDWWECKSEGGEPLNTCERALSMEAGVLTLNVLNEGQVSANIGGKSFGKKDSSMLSPATWELFVAEPQVILVQFTPVTSSDHMLVFFNIAYPTASPTSMPVTLQPSSNPTTPIPSRPPTRNPSANPTNSPTPNPTVQTSNPSPAPTYSSTPNPSNRPTNSPTKRPTSRRPTRKPTSSPSRQPSKQPTTQHPTYTPPYSSSTTLQTARLLLTETVIVSNTCSSPAFLSLPPSTRPMNKSALLFARSSNNILDCVYECERTGLLCAALAFKNSVCELYSSIPSIPESLCVSLADLSLSQATQGDNTFVAITRNLFSSAYLQTLQSSAEIIRLEEVSRTIDLNFQTFIGSSPTLNHRQALIFRSHNDWWESLYELQMELDSNEDKVVVFGIVNGILLSAGNYAKIFIESSIDGFFKESGIVATVENWSVVSDSHMSFLVLQTIRMQQDVTIGDLRLVLSNNYADWITSDLQEIFKTDVSYLPVFVSALVSGSDILSGEWNWNSFDDNTRLDPRNPDEVAAGSPSSVLTDSLIIVGVVVVAMFVCKMGVSLYLRKYRRSKNSPDDSKTDSGRSGERGNYSMRQDWQKDALITPGDGEQPLLEPEGLTDSSSECSFGYERDSLTLPGEPEHLPYSDTADCGSFGAIDRGDEEMTTHLAETEEMNNLNKSSNLDRQKWY